LNSSELSSMSLIEFSVIVGFKKGLRLLMLRAEDRDSYPMERPIRVFLRIGFGMLVLLTTMLVGPRVDSLLVERSFDYLEVVRGCEAA
jgi:hypothetical protein